MAFGKPIPYGGRMGFLVNYPSLTEGASWAECLAAAHISTSVDFRSSCGIQTYSSKKGRKNQAKPPLTPSLTEGELSAGKLMRMWLADRTAYGGEGKF
ncbi:hypothetical protein [Candidatus Hakubella thermalkaliphila]|uniref:hypothetical protein n=2 Tax=Candidatus Hakubella thermalkaliphila TaxID=2754717 RepID=UPI001593D8B6|nr:hypothetical protein [Candidatus Hakubella thermalkaliphila]